MSVFVHILFIYTYKKRCVLLAQLQFAAAHAGWRGATKFRGPRNPKCKEGTGETGASMGRVSDKLGEWHPQGRERKLIQKDICTSESSVFSGLAREGGTGVCKEEERTERVTKEVEGGGARQRRTRPEVARLRRHVSAESASCSIVALQICQRWGRSGSRDASPFHTAGHKPGVLGMTSVM